MLSTAIFERRPQLQKLGARDTQTHKYKNALAKTRTRIARPLRVNSPRYQLDHAIESEHSSTKAKSPPLYSNLTPQPRPHPAKESRSRAAPTEVDIDVSTDNAEGELYVWSMPVAVVFQSKDGATVAAAASAPELRTKCAATRSCWNPAARDRAISAFLGLN